MQSVEEGIVGHCLGWYNWHMFHQNRFVAVIALLGIAAALATEKGRLPLALRGMKRMLQRDAGASEQQARKAVPLWKRLLAFALVVLAFVVAVAF